LAEQCSYQLLRHLFFDPFFKRMPVMKEDAYRYRMHTVSCAPCASRDGASSRAMGGTAADLGGITVRSNMFPSGAVTLKNGEYHEPAAPGSTIAMVVKLTACVPSALLLVGMLRLLSLSPISVAAARSLIWPCSSKWMVFGPISTPRTWGTE